MNRMNSLFHEGFRPNQFQQFTLGGKPPGAAHQSEQHVIRLWLESDCLDASAKPPFSCTQRELSEFVNLQAGHKSLSES
jgi:hypothetical protein